MANYSATFSQDIDVMWNHYDFDNNGYLDREEARGFVDQVSKCIGKERSKNYNPDHFDYLFDKFDENQDEYLTKSEMAVYVKKVFTNQNRM